MRKQMTQQARHYARLGKPELTPAQRGFRLWAVMSTAAVAGVMLATAGLSEIEMLARWAAN